jgi:hypothetical protein
MHRDAAAILAVVQQPAAAVVVELGSSRHPLRRVRGEIALHDPAVGVPKLDQALGVHRGHSTAGITLPPRAAVAVFGNALAG